MNTTVIRVMLIGTLLLSSTADARRIEHWPYKRLFGQSDIVVIARAINSVPNERPWKEPLFDPGSFSGVITQFRVISTIKGSPSQTIGLLHYQYTTSNTPMNDGPNLLSFYSSPVSTNVQTVPARESEQKNLTEKRQTSGNIPEYLLFLRKNEDGTYEAVSGQVDPAFSVRALFAIPSIAPNPPIFLPNE